MGRGLNKVMLIGNLGRDPEMRYTPSGKPVTSFSMASSRSWISSDGERKEETEWFNVVAWGNLAEICNQHLTRGQQVYIEGRLQTRSWEDANGQRHFRTEVVANEMIILGNRSGYNNHSSADDYVSTEEDLF
jgi:single-strand DNA-binding protein